MQARLQELVAYRARGQPWPRSAPSVTGQEHEPGVWLRGQRHKYRQGQMDPARAQALDAALPGWADGRKTGPAPLQ
ncbi:helicase associated domain-containing protein [Arthrobacter sp. NPDC056691]|uniref:helicase associated domain-containing protein n=1 Tax=Arthrobacter sp. NPDC056691 TaxID=3345913 RepID=UPI00367211EA